jgi:hypothetical protein
LPGPSGCRKTRRWVGLASGDPEAALTRGFRGEAWRTGCMVFPWRVDPFACATPAMLTCGIPVRYRRSGRWMVSPLNQEASKSVWWARSMERHAGRASVLMPLPALRAVGIAAGGAGSATENVRGWAMGSGSSSSRARRVGSQSRWFCRRPAATKRMPGSVRVRCFGWAARFAIIAFAEAGAG